MDIMHQQRNRGSHPGHPPAVERENIQKQIQQDWQNREYVEIITGSIKKITEFLNSFDASCRGRLALLNERLTQLERKIDYLEARISKGEPVAN